MTNFSDGAERSASRPALEALTGLRFVAALGVVLFHAVPNFSGSTDSFGARLASFGYIGVSLFFVLSGFILAYVYLDPGTRRIRGSARAFWWARVARVYPVYLFGLVIALPFFIKAVQRAGGGGGRTIATAVLTPLLLQGWWTPTACQWNCPGWSLSVEAFFYCLFPLVGVWMLRRNSAAVPTALMIWVVGLVLPLGYLTLSPDGLSHLDPTSSGTWLEVLKFNPVPHLPEFLLGIASGLAFLERDIGRSTVVQRRVSAALVLLTPVALLTVPIPYPLLHTGLLAPVWALLIYHLAIGHGAAARVLRWRPIVRLGEASYALYLTHQPVLNVVLHVRKVLTGTSAGFAPVLLVGYLVVALSVSIVVFRLLEEPARRAVRNATSPRSSFDSLADHSARSGSFPAARRSP